MITPAIVSSAAGSRRTSSVLRVVALALVLTLGSSGCYRGGGRLFGAMAWTALVTAAIVSSAPPPRPVYVQIPPPHPGYSWQPGYWTPEDDDWVWVEGRWIREYPGYYWSPTRWVEDPGGHWRLLPGSWVASEPRPPPPPR